MGLPVLHWVDQPYAVLDAEPSKPTWTPFPTSSEARRRALDAVAAYVSQLPMLFEMDADWRVLLDHAIGGAWVPASDSCERARRRDEPEAWGGSGFELVAPPA